MLKSVLFLCAVLLRTACAVSYDLVSGWEFSNEAAAKIDSSDGKVGDNFGTSVCMCGSYAYVGAPFDRTDGYFSGSVYTFQLADKGGWSLVDKLSPQYPEDYAWFGGSVACDKSLAAVGSPLNSSGYAESGAVYVYGSDPSGVTLLAEFTSYFPEDYEHFGFSVAVGRDLLLVGATGSSAFEIGAKSGVVYAYRIDLSSTDDLIDEDDYYTDSKIPKGWTLEAIFYPADVVPGDQFGFDIAVSGSLIIVGSPFANGRRGVAHVFNRTLVFDENDNDNDDGGSYPSYLMLKKFSDDESVDRKDFFGISVDVHAHTIVIGEHMAYDESHLVQSGAVHVFTTHTSMKQITVWQHAAVLREPVESPVSNYFGRGVAVRDNTILVDAPGGTKYFNATSYSFGRYKEDSDLKTSDREKRLNSFIYKPTEEGFSFWSHQATLVGTGRSLSSVSPEYMGQSVHFGDHGVGLVGSPTTIGGRGVASGAFFAFSANPVEGGSSDTDDEPQLEANESQEPDSNINKSLIWMVFLIPAFCIVLGVYLQRKKRRRKRAGPSTFGRSFGEGTGGYDDYENTTEISDLDSDAGFGGMRGRFKNKLSMFSMHAKSWIDGSIKNPVCLIKHRLSKLSSYLFA